MGEHYMPNVIVLTQGDSDFKSRIGRLLNDYGSARIGYFDECSFYLKGAEVGAANVILINGDRFRLTDKCKNRFKRLSRSRKSGAPVNVFMLTRKLTVSDFLRNQSYFVTDTIDISGDLDVLKKALDGALLSGVA